MSKKVTTGMLKSATIGNQYPTQNLPTSKNPERYKKVSQNGPDLKYSKSKGERANDQR